MTEEEVAKRKMEQRERKLERMREVWRWPKLGLGLRIVDLGLKLSLLPSLGPRLKEK